VESKKQSPHTSGVLYNSLWRYIFTEPEPNLNKFTKINDIITHNVIAQIKYSNLETEPNVTKKLNKIIKSKSKSG